MPTLTIYNALEHVLPTTKTGIATINAAMIFKTVLKLSSHYSDSIINTLMMLRADSLPKIHQLISDQ